MTHLCEAVWAAVAAAVYPTSAITKDRTWKKSFIRSMAQLFLPLSVVKKSPSSASFCSEPRNGHTLLSFTQPSLRPALKQMVWNKSVLFYTGSV